MKFLNIGVLLLLILTACGVGSGLSLHEEAKALSEEVESTFSMNNTNIIDGTVTLDKIQVRKELVYLPNEEKPYTGFAVPLVDEADDSQAPALIKFDNGYVSAIMQWRADGTPSHYMEYEKLDSNAFQFTADGFEIYGEDIQSKQKLSIYWTEKSELGGVCWGVPDFTDVEDEDLEYYKNAQSSIWGVVDFSDKHIHYTYYESGQRSLQWENNGELVLIAESWKPNGEASEESVTNGNGKHIGYYESGILNFTESYKDGYNDGEFVYYAEDGSIIIKELYKDGELIKTSSK